jgi:hypothetical protein
MIKSRGMRWPGHVALMGEIRNTYKISVGMLKGRAHSYDLDVDGSTSLMEMRLEGVDWILLAQDRDRWQSLVNTVMNFRVP